MLIPNLQRKRSSENNVEIVNPMVLTIPPALHSLIREYAKSGVLGSTEQEVALYLLRTAIVAIEQGGK